MLHVLVPIVTPVLIGKVCFALILIIKIVYIHYNASAIVGSRIYRCVTR